jgi:hypothetical protein
MKEMNKTLLSDDDNFKLIGYEVEAIFNDYERYLDIYFETDIEVIREKVKKILLNKENCDESYYVDYTPIYEIKNEAYYIFHELSYYQQEVEEVFKGKKVINGDEFSENIKTPDANVPLNIDLLRKLQEKLPYLVNDNGETNYEKVEEMKGLLNRF